ncbi:cytochrome oxidase complex assembly protein [Tasmannia lanceolata]|uniref:cytochrome oxidase complex assembly protein n=1 Tax=Tasmannia lanceolata TaxID=3420 RepID=UPI004063A345
MSGRRFIEISGRRFISPLLKNSLNSSNLSFSTSVEAKKKRSLGRKLVSVLLFSVTGGLALSALDDLAIYHGCTSKAIEKANQNKAIVDALGEPIVRGPWYNASLAVAHKRHSVSCTFPVAGTQGTGIFQLKAIRQDNSWLSFLRYQDWEILVMEALVHAPGNEEKQQTFRINLMDNNYPPDCKAC